jgi:aminoglycoside phosphotransferase (APT) family kinase protein
MSAEPPVVESPPGLEVGPVSEWLAAELGLAPPLRFERVGAGQSNLTFRVRDRGGREVVLRRPPLGKLLPSAHDMGREHRVMSALWRAGMPVPRTLAFCGDAEVTGAPFYVMDVVEGTVISREEVALAFDADARHTVGISMAETLARLHALDIEEIGLADLASHDNYAARQLRRWRRQWEASKTRELPVVEDVAERLAAAIPEQREVRLVHGDFHVGNVMLDERGRVRAVLDWELCTLGDPVGDLGNSLAYWWHADEEAPAMHAAISTLPGFARREELTGAYAAVSGRDLSVAGFYRTLGLWKIAIVLEGIYARWLQNPANSDRGEQLPAMAELFAARAGAAADEAGL